MPELHQLILDRIEDNKATLENDAGKQITIPAHWLPAGTKPGEVLDITNIPQGDQSTITFTRNQTATQAREKEMRELRAGLKKGPAGDIKL